MSQVVLEVVNDSGTKESLQLTTVDVSGLDKPSCRFQTGLILTSRLFAVILMSPFMRRRHPRPPRGK